MDEFRGQYGSYYRDHPGQQAGHSTHHGYSQHSGTQDGHHGEHHSGHHEAHHHHAEGHVVQGEGGGILHNFGLGAFEEYLPMVLIGLGILGVYLWLQKEEGGLAGIFGRFL